MNNTMSRRRLCAGIALFPAATLGLPGCGGGGDATDASQHALLVRGHALETDAPARWAAIAMRAAALAAPPGLPPHYAARSYAMAFLAAHDALNAIVPVYASYGAPVSAPGANPDAAVATAVHDVLVHEWSFATSLLDDEYAAALAAVQGSGSTSKGVAIGRACAAAMLAARADDGLAAAQGPFTEGTAAGEYRYTPPFNFAADVRWGEVMRPFAIARASDFRVDKPYALASKEYAADFAEVASLGAAVGSTRTADQSDIGRFWLENTPDSWMKIALQLAPARGLQGWALMRALALIQVAQLDAYTACFESKYFYHFWRPITAIRLADDDGNGATTAQPNWVSFDPVCPPVPDYPSGHSASGGAGAVVLEQLFGGDTASFTHQSVTLPGPTRHFTSFSQAQNEIGVSRIYVGYHFRNAVAKGIAQGRAVATRVMATQLPALG